MYIAIYVFMYVHNYIATYMHNYIAMYMHNYYCYMYVYSNHIRMYLATVCPINKAVNIICRLLFHIMRTLRLDYAWAWG